MRAVGARVASVEGARGTTCTRRGMWRGSPRLWLVVVARPRLDGKARLVDWGATAPGAGPRQTAELTPFGAPMCVAHQLQPGLLGSASTPSMLVTPHPTTGVRYESTPQDTQVEPVNAPPVARAPPQGACDRSWWSESDRRFPGLLAGRLGLRSASWGVLLNAAGHPATFVSRS